MLGRRVLISGASFAGLSTAYWMKGLGYDVTVVEISKNLKSGGTPVNIRGGTVDLVRRMGLLDQVRANTIRMNGFEFKDANNKTVGFMPAEESGAEEFEIERDVLLKLFFDAVRADVEFIFDETVVSLQEVPDGVDVSFKRGANRKFDLVFGCDGIHSTIRKLWFGEEKKFAHFLGVYFSITIVKKLMIEENAYHMYNEPGIVAALSAYNGKTDIVLCFASDEEIHYDYRNEDEQRQIIYDRFNALPWRVPELIREVKGSQTFYFDKLCQIKMPSWTAGRVALVGDAGYCASPAAGMGGSLAIHGAGALADAFAQYGGNHEAAFQAYDRMLRPFIDKVQSDAVNFGLDVFVPRTEEAIRKRNDALA